MFGQLHTSSASRHVSTPIEPLERRALLSVAAQLVEVPISAAAVAAEPVLASHRSFDLRVTVSAEDRFTIAGFEAVLTQGRFYRFDDSLTTNPALWSISPQSEFATFVCVDGFFPPNSGVLPYIGVPGTPILTDTRFIPVWGTLGAGASANAFTIARLTVPSDAVGSIYGDVRSVQATTGAPFVDSLPSGAVPIAQVRGNVRSFFDLSLSGVTIFADSDNDSVLDTGEPRTLSVNGAYQLMTPPGVYHIRVVPDAQYPQVVSPGGGSYPVNLAARQALSRLDFVLHRPGAGNLRGSVTENNASTTGTSGPLPLVTVYLDLNQNGALDASEPSRVTGADGIFAFDGIIPATYRVRAVTGSTSYGPLGNVDGIVVGVGDGQTQFVNFAFQRIDIAAIRGTVQSVGTNGPNAPLSGWTVYLDSNQSGTLDAGEPTDTTDAQGRFDFLVAPGTHLLRQIVQTGYEQASPSPVFGGAFVVYAAGGTAETRTFLNNVSMVTTAVSGMVRRPALHVLPGQQAGLSGWLVFLDADNNGFLSGAEPFTHTAADGSYHLQQTAPYGQGNTKVRVEKRAGFRRMSYTPEVFNVNLPTGGSSIVNFDYTQRIMLAGVVFDDKNANQVKNAGENGVRGRRVWVDLNNNALIDANEPGGYVGVGGVFGFEDLVAGTYTIRVEEIAGWRNTGPGALTVTLAAGKVRVGIPFGQQKVVPPAGSMVPAPRNIGVLSPERDLGSVWARI